MTDSRKRTNATMWPLRIQPSVKTAKQGSDHGSQLVRLPPISNRVQLSHDQNPLNLHAALPRINEGCNNATKRSLRIQQSVKTAKQGSDHASQQVGLPPISNRVQLPHVQNQLQPHPPPPRIITGCNNPTNKTLRIQQSVKTAKQGSDHASQQVRLPPIPNKVQLPILLKYRNISLYR